MSATVIIYILAIISGSTRVEIISNPGLTAAQCRQAGEGWLKSKLGHQYECRASAQTINTK